MTPFDITIFDNKTKSQAKFYSLNVESTQSSMGFPINLKFPFGNSGTVNSEQFTNAGLFAPPPLNSNQGFVINNNENGGSTGINNNQFGNGGDVLNCEDFDGKTNILVGSNDPNNLDDDGDGIGCEDDNINNNNIDNGFIGGKSENSRCPDGFHRSPSGDCERVTDTSGMPRCPDGFHRSPDGDCEEVRNNADNDDNNNDNSGSNPCTAEQASRDHTCTSSSGDNDEIDDWTDPPVEEDNNEASENDSENPTTDSQNESGNNDESGEEQSDSEESTNNEDNGSNNESDGEDNVN